MDEVELLRALGDVWSDATKIIESMHALRKKIKELLDDAQGDDELAEIYELVHNQIEAVMSSLRISQARIESSVMEALPATTSSSLVTSSFSGTTPFRVTALVLRAAA